MTKRRRLSDLYIRGAELEIDDGSGDPVAVWLQKLNDIDRTAVIRRAHAAKARFMIDSDHEESEAFSAMYGQIREIGERDDVLAIIIGEDLGKARTRLEAQLMSDEESWGKDGYLQSLLDSWTGDDDNPGLAAAEAENPGDPEASRVHAELDRFDAELQKAVQAEAEMLRGAWESLSDDELWRKASHRALEVRGEEVFIREYERQILFYCVREPDQHSKRYFGNIGETNDLPDEVREALIAKFNEISMPQLEGKESRASQDSLNSSASAEEISPDSGLVGASA